MQQKNQQRFNGDDTQASNKLNNCDHTLGVCFTENDKNAKKMIESM